MVRCFSLSAVRPVQGPLYSFKTLCILSSDVGGTRVTQPTLGNTAREMDFQSIIRGCDSQDIEKRCRNANSATSEPLFVKWGDLLRSLRSPDHWWPCPMRGPVPEYGGGHWHRAPGPVTRPAQSVRTLQSVNMLTRIGVSAPLHLRN